MLEIKGLVKDYGDFRLNCSMKVGKGCITGLVGQNGAGKSTTFKAALGLISCDSGEVSILGKPSSELTARDRQKMGVALNNSIRSRLRSQPVI